jgi:hypothetical protein
MPEFAQFIVLQTEFSLPDPDTGNTFHVRPIAFPDLDRTRTAILLYNMTVDGDVQHLTMRFNDHEPFAEYDRLPKSAEPWNSWHEIIQGSDLKVDNNELVVVVNGPGIVQLFHLVVFYHARTPG